MASTTVKTAVTVTDRGEVESEPETVISEPEEVPDLDPDLSTEESDSIEDSPDTDSHFDDSSKSDESEDEENEEILEDSHFHAKAEEAIDKEDEERAQARANWEAAAEKKREQAEKSLKAQISEEDGDRQSLSQLKAAKHHNSNSKNLKSKKKLKTPQRRLSAAQIHKLNEIPIKTDHDIFFTHPPNLPFPLEVLHHTATTILNPLTTLKLVFHDLKNRFRHHYH